MPLSSKHSATGIVLLLMLSAILTAPGDAQTQTKRPQAQREDLPVPGFWDPRAGRSGRTCRACSRSAS